MCEALNVRLVCAIVCRVLSHAGTTLGMTKTRLFCFTPRESTCVMRKGTLKNQTRVFSILFLGFGGCVCEQMCEPGK